MERRFTAIGAAMNEESGKETGPRNNLVVLPPGDIKPDVRIPNELLSADPETLVGKTYVFMRSLVYTLVRQDSLPPKIDPDTITEALTRHGHRMD